MRLAHNITRVAARKVSACSNNTSSPASRLPNRKESTSTKSIQCPIDTRNAIGYPSIYSGVALSDRVAVDGACNTVSCFVDAAALRTTLSDALSLPEEEQDEQSTGLEHKKELKKPNTGDDITLRWDIIDQLLQQSDQLLQQSDQLLQQSETPLPRPLVNFEDFCFETPKTTITTSLTPPPSPRVQQHSMIRCIRPPIPEALLLPVF